MGGSEPLLLGHTGSGRNQPASKASCGIRKGLQSERDETSHSLIVKEYSAAPGRNGSETVQAEQSSGDSSSNASH